MTKVNLDFTRVDAALKLATRERELAADREQLAIARGRAAIATNLITYSAAGATVLIVSVGLAIWLATPKSGMPSNPIITGTNRVQPQAVPVQGVPPNKIVSNINLFNSIDARDLGLANPYIISLNAGHGYEDSNSDHWETAWCYADFRKDELDYRVTLAYKTRAGNLDQPASENERRQLLLTEKDMSYLRGQCPWRPK